MINVYLHKSTYIKCCQQEIHIKHLQTGLIKEESFQGELVTI